MQVEREVSWLEHHPPGIELDWVADDILDLLPGPEVRAFRKDQQCRITITVKVEKA